MAYLLTLAFLDMHSCRVGYTEKIIAGKGGGGPKLHGQTDVGGIDGWQG
jgi:hypothetical protein